MIKRFLTWLESVNPTPAGTTCYHRTISVVWVCLACTVTHFRWKQVSKALACVCLTQLLFPQQAFFFTNVPPQHIQHGRLFFFIYIIYFFITQRLIMVNLSPLYFHCKWKSSSLNSAPDKSLLERCKRRDNWPWSCWLIVHHTSYCLLKTQHFQTGILMQLSHNLQVFLSRPLL